MKGIMKKGVLIAVAAMLVFTTACENTEKKVENTTTVTTAEATTEEAKDENATLGGLITDGKLVMGTNAAFPPFEYLEGSTIVGFDVDVMAEVAKELGLEFEIKDMEFDSLPTALSQGQIDVIAAGLTARPDREETMDFSQSYYEAVQTIIVLADSDIATADDLTDKVIGVQTGTTGSWLAEEYTAISNVKGYANGMLAVEALRTGSVDAVIIDNNPAKVYGDQYPNEVVLLNDQFDPEFYVFAVKKGNKELLEKIDEVLQEMREDGRFDEIKDRYLSE